MSSRKDHKQKTARRLRRKRHIRRRISGTEDRPRLVVVRSLRHIYCQIIDDQKGRTLAAASTMSKTRSGDIRGAGGNCKAAAEVGTAIAETALARGIENVSFDRGGYRFHGRVKALAEAARKGGLKF